jgi:ABC-2 type transport system permease protein
MMRKVSVIARHEFALLLRSRGFRLGLLLPTVLVVAVMLYFGSRVPPEAMQAAKQAAAQHGMDNPIGLGAAYLFVLLMFIGILTLSQYLLTNLIEEKSSRVVEVLLSAVSPLELMAGKILGLCAAGLAGIGACVAIIASVAKLQGFIGAVNPWAFGLFIVYYVLGILLISSMYAAVGSACNSLREAQGLMVPMALLFVVPLAAWMQIAQHPEGLFATLLSFLPPLTPMVMILRLAASRAVPAWQVVLSLAVLAAAVPVTMWAAAKVFRTGVLMYGKPPKLREMFRWMRYR